MSKTATKKSETNTAFGARSFICPDAWYRTAVEIEREIEARRENN